VIRKLGALFALATLSFGVSACNAHVRGVVVVIGDSNVVESATSFTNTLSNRDNGYVPVLFAHDRGAIRETDCQATEQTNQPCTTYDFWKIRLQEGLPKIDGDAFVIELGVNDTASPGTPTTTGYSGYDGKVDYLMALLPSDKPVLWTNLPCPIEPSSRQRGCAAVNAALAAASARWPNLTVLDWEAAAGNHTEWLTAPGDVHYKRVGQDAWSGLVVAALDARFPDPGGTTTTTSTTSTTSTTTVPVTTTTAPDSTTTVPDSTTTVPDTTTVPESTTSTTGP
jgi:hypothetical protein